jgi:DNA-binding response OmpR family regulator
MYNLLVVDDEPGIRGIIRKYAEFEGHAVTECGDGMEAVELCRREVFDLIILDIMMPELDGFAVCKEIRKTRRTPVIMLSARGEEYDKIHGFELGIDDYVVKPFSPRELMMRVQAVMNRSRPAAEDALSFPGLLVDAGARLLYVDGRKVEMSPKEFDLLYYMARNSGKALTREKLIQDVWGYDFFGDDRTLDTHIKLLRRSLDRYSGCIVTLRGVGYRFEA